MYKAECSKCDKSFHKTSKKKAEAALRMHEGRVHGNIKNGNKPSNVDGMILTAAEGDSNGGVALGTRRSTRRVLGQQRKPARKPVSDKKREREETMKAIEHQIEVAQAAEHFKFCPECGNNLEVLLRAYIVARRHRRREALDA